MPPKMTLGSFETVSHDIQKRTIYVYWRQIPDFNRNGPNFTYIVTEVMEAGQKKIVPIVPNKVTKAYAMFTDLRLANYTFFVTSQNDNGTAEGPATKIFVPHYDQSKIHSTFLKTRGKSLLELWGTTFLPD